MPEKFKSSLNIIPSIFLLVVLLGLVWSAALAQRPVTLSNLEVDLWPEYDRPSVLVIYRITLSPDVTLPADLTLRIPVEAGEPHAVAAKQPDGSLLNVDYTRSVSGDWGEVSLTASQPELQVEYYDPGITQDGATRRFEYRWPGDYTVDDMMIQVQQPLGATSLSTSPSLGELVTDANGLNYYNSNIGALSAGQEFDIRVEYEKATDGLTAAGLQVQPSAPVADTALGWRSRLQPALPWGLLVLGVILLVGGAVWYWQSGKRGQEQPRPRRRRKPAAAAETPAPEGHVYCHSCGKRAGPGDKFCRACGTRLRQE